MAEVVASIIIPVYNVEDYLRECLDSIFVRQKLLHKVEVIAVNDGSTDGSPEILEEYARKYGLTVINQKNQGPGAARNNGMSAAKGKYILFIDSDDSFVTDALNGILDILASSDVDFVDFSMRSAKSLTGRVKFDRPVIGSGQAFFSAMQKKKGHSTVAWTKAVSKKFIVERNISFPTGIYFEDEEWNVRLYAYAEKACLCPLKFYQYRKRDESMVHSHAFKSYTDSVIIIDDLYDFSCSDNLSDEFKAALRNHLSSIYFIALQGVKTQGIYHEELISALEKRRYILRYSRIFHRKYFYRFLLAVLGVKTFFNLKYYHKNPAL